MRKRKSKGNLKNLGAIAVISLLIQISLEWKVLDKSSARVQISELGSNQPYGRL